MMEDHDGPLLRREPAERVVEVVARGDRARHVWRGGKVHLKEPDATGVATFTAALGIAGVDDEPMEPGVEPERVTKCRKVSPCPEQRLLRRVLGAVGIPEDPV